MISTENFRGPITSKSCDMLFIGISLSGFTLGTIPFRRNESYFDLLCIEIKVFQYFFTFISSPINIDSERAFISFRQSATVSRLVVAPATVKRRMLSHLADLNLNNKIRKIANYKIHN